MFPSETMLNQNQQFRGKFKGTNCVGEQKYLTFSLSEKIIAVCSPTQLFNVLLDQFNILCLSRR